MTNETFGKRVGVTHSMASRIRNGIRLPSVKVMRSISSEFDISMEELTAAHEQGGEAFAALLKKRVFTTPAAAAVTTVAS